MPHLIKLAAGKLNDPILMNWALDRYRQASKGHSHCKEAMERAWFDELTLRRWLNSDDQEALNRLFIHLPEEQFANLGQAIGERWNTWGGNLAYHSAPILARYQPDLAWRCFAEPSGGRHRDIESILGVIRSLSVLPREEGLQLLDAIAKQVLTSTEDSFTHKLLLSELVSASLVLDRVVALEVIKAQLKETSREREWNQLLDQVARSFFGHSVYRQLASDIRKGETQQSFQQLEALFRADAPLGQLDQLSREKANLDDLIKLVDRFLNEQDRSVARLITETTRSKQFAERRDTVAMQGNEVAAFQLLDQALESKAHWRFFLTDVASPAQLTAQFAQLYNELLRSLGRTDRASLHASFLGASKKVGRNDPCPCPCPCPCGSGKKYKKCCL